MNQINMGMAKMAFEFEEKKQYVATQAEAWKIMHEYFKQETNGFSVQAPDPSSAFDIRWKNIDQLATISAQWFKRMRRILLVYLHEGSFQDEKTINVKSRAIKWLRLFKHVRPKPQAVDLIAMGRAVVFLIRLGMLPSDITMIGLQKLMDYGEYLRVDSSTYGEYDWVMIQLGKMLEGCGGSMRVHSAQAKAILAEANEQWKENKMMEPPQCQVDVDTDVVKNVVKNVDTDVDTDVDMDLIKAHDEMEADGEEEDEDMFAVGNGVMSLLSDEAVVIIRGLQEEVDKLTKENTELKEKVETITQENEYMRSQTNSPILPRM